VSGAEAIFLVAMVGLGVASFAALLLSISLGRIARRRATVLDEYQAALKRQGNALNELGETLTAWDGSLNQRADALDRLGKSIDVRWERLLQATSGRAAKSETAREYRSGMRVRYFNEDWTVVEVRFIEGDDVLTIRSDKDPKTLGQACASRVEFLEEVPAIGEPA
jgi:hypothetical protein